MAIHLLGTACIRHATLTATLAPQCVARISAQQLTTEEKSAFHRLNDCLLAFEQKMLTIYQGLSCLVWFTGKIFTLKCWYIAVCIRPIRSLMQTITISSV